MNERTHFFIKIYLSHFILERVDVGFVWEMSWRRGQTATYWPKVLLAIAALLSHLGWVDQPWVTEGWKPLVCKLILMLASCPPTDSNSNWNWLKLSVAPAYIIVKRSPGLNPRSSHTKDLKMVLDTPLLNTQQYKVRIKGKVEQSRERRSAVPYTSCSSYWKRSLLVALDYGHRLYFTTYIVNTMFHIVYVWYPFHRPFLNTRLGYAVGLYRDCLMWLPGEPSSLVSQTKLTISSSLRGPFPRVLTLSGAPFFRISRPSLRYFLCLSDVSRPRPCTWTHLHLNLVTRLLVWWSVR